jgi:hypothetical protein
MLTLAKEKAGGAAMARIIKLEAKVRRKQRQIRENLRQNRDSYWTEVADRLETAYGSRDMKLYYKLIKEAHGPQLASTTKGRQALAGQHMKDRQGIQRTITKEGMEARWIEHFTDLFNQPGVLGEGIDLSMPARRAISPKIKTGSFNKAELHTAIKDMNNDKAAGLDGYGIEVEKYIAGEQYMEMELEMYNTILQSGDMPAILRDVIITVLYKGKGPRDICDSYRGISLMAHKGKLLERLILNRLKPALRRCHTSEPIWLHHKMRDAGCNISIAAIGNRCH